LLNSGNVVFRAGRGAPNTHADRIAAALIERLGVPANTLVLPSQTLEAAIADNPFAARIDDPSRMMVGFFIDDTDRSSFEALKREFPDEFFAIGTHACYLLCIDGILESRIANALAGAKFRDRVTARNWATTLKLHAMVSG
jgi:uncharacterized protein (DUF1697 family)